MTAQKYQWLIFLIGHTILSLYIYHPYPPGPTSAMSNNTTRVYGGNDEERLID